MNWLPPFRRQFDPNEPDKEGISLGDATERAYDIATYSLFYDPYVDIYAEDVSLEVTKKMYISWSKRGPGLYKNKKNRAFLIDQAAFEVVEEYKKRWVASGRSIDQETMDIWFLEALIEYILDHRSMFVAVGIGNVLFTYENTEVQQVLDKLASETIDDSQLRRAKGRILEYFKKTNKKGEFKRCAGRFLKIVARPDHKNEYRFAARLNSLDSFDFVKYTLSRLTPLQPYHPFPPEFYDDSFDVGDEDVDDWLRKRYNLGLVDWIKQYDVYKTSDGRERVRMHTLLDPECWIPLFKNLLIVKKREKVRMEFPEMKLEMPEYSSFSQIDIANKPPASKSPMNRSQVRKMSEELKEKIKKRAAEWDRDRKKFSAQSLMIVVNGEEHCQISTNNPRVVSEAFSLEDGDSFIDIHGINKQGQTILLDTHYLSWDRDEIGKGLLRLATRLNNGRKLELLVKYEKDEFGDPIGATVDVIYDPTWAYSLGRRLTTANAYPITWKGVAVAFAAGVAAAIATRKLVEALVNSKLSARVLDKSFSRKARWSLSAATVNAWRALCIIVIALFIPWASMMPAFISGRQTIQSAPAQAVDNQSASASEPKSVNAAPEIQTSSTDGASSSNATNKGAVNSSRKVKSSPAPKIEKGVTPSVAPQRNFTNEQVSTEARNSRDANNRTEPLQPAAYGSSPERSGMVVGIASEPATRTAAIANTDRTASPERVSSTVSEAAAPAVGISSTSQGGTATVASNASPARRAQEMIKIEKGQRIRLRPERVTDSQKVNRNDEFRSVVVDPVYVNGKEVIPANSIITGKVSKVARASEEGDLGIVDIKFNSLLLVNNPRPIKIKGELYDPLRNAKGVFVGNSEAGAKVERRPDKYTSPNTSPRRGASFAGCGIKRVSTRKATDAVIKPETVFEIRLKESVTLPLSPR